MSFTRFATLFATLAAASLLQAQENRASISGQVTDSTGAAVPRAAIKIVNSEQGSVKDTSTNDTGRYQAGFLEPGEYTVTIEALHDSSTPVVILPSSDSNNVTITRIGP